MPKRTIAEWITVAKLSRNVGHIFFEGESDARILRSLLESPENVDFRTASEVDGAGLESHPFWGGFKLRLMILAFDAAKASSGNLRCFVDSDFSSLVSHLYRSDNLFETKYANLPASTLTFKWLESLLSKAYGFALNDGIWDFFCKTVKFCFCSRFLMGCADNPRAAPNLASFVRFEKGKFCFDAREYVRKYFQVNIDISEEIAQHLEDFCDWADFDIRHLANSNDVFDLIYTMLRKSGKIGASLPRDAIRHTYYAGMDKHIVKQSGFMELKDWLEKYNAERS